MQLSDYASGKSDFPVLIAVASHTALSSHFCTDVASQCLCFREKRDKSKVQESYKSDLNLEAGRK